jgi:hypothetical protein
MSSLLRWQESKPEFLEFLTLKKPMNRFQGFHSASFCSLVGRYDKPICSTVRLDRIAESIPGLLQRLKIRAQFLCDRKKINRM